MSAVPSNDPPETSARRPVDGGGFSAATLASVELPTLLRLLAELATTDVGRQRILDLAPAATSAELDRRRRLQADATMLLTDGRLVPSTEEPLRPALDRLASDLDGEARDLLVIATLLRATDGMRRRIGEAKEREKPPEALAELVESLPDLEPLRRRIDAVLDARGRVREDASKELVRLRKAARDHRDRLYGELRRAAESYGEQLAEETIPVRAGRLVLLLKSGAKGQSRGLVHGSSGTGRSVYFEPIEAVEGNNRLSEALEREEEERARLVRELLDEARASREQLEAHLDIVATLDLLQAAHDLADRLDGRAADSGDPGGLRLVGARHPLLDPRLADLRRRALGTEGHRGEVVPLDLELDSERRVLVVTGPNAGGKTVALKTLGLTAAMHQCGLPVPAARGTRLPFLPGLVATVGDDQDVLADRSTFSGRLLRLREAWEAGEGWLVLLDELGTGTDPDEGAALAVALTERLLDSGTLALVTTHLARLAASALELEGAACAAMAFDDATGEPAFELVPGAPGTSEALALARRLGLSAAWIERAESLLDPEHRKLQQLLVEVESTQRALAEELSVARAERRELEERTRATAEKEEALEAERRELADRLREELESYQREVRLRMGRETERIRQALEAGRRKGVAAAAAERALEGEPEELAPSEDEVGDVAMGDTVRHRALGWEGVLESLDGERAEVKVRGKRLRCSREELVPVSPSGESPARAERSGSGVTTSVDGDVSSELQLIGRRVEAALEELDRYLDRAILSSHREVRVVHGHGSGRLRRAVRERLDRHPAVAAWSPAPPDRGGDGATRVELDRG